MYSVVLMMAMSAPADVPRELFPNRPHLVFGRPTGCQGARAASPRPLAAWLESRRSAKVSSGCAGSSVTFAAPSGCSGSQVRLATGCAGSALALAPAGCSGGAARSIRIEALAQTGPLVLSGKPMTVTLAPNQPPLAAGSLIQRLAVHRQLRVALRSGNLTGEQAEVARRALDDPDVYEAAVTKVHRDLLRSMQAKGVSSPPTVAAFGDGHILQLLLDNLPKIIEAIRQIIALFGFNAAPPYPVDSDYLPMPRGPHAPARIVMADYRLAC